MVSETVVIESALGVHLRPATAMCDQAVRFKSKIHFTYKDGKTANAKSVISILASGIRCGEQIEIVAEGPDEEEALRAIVKAFKESLMND
ncbi:MAG: HPr family phosphocarrier protein [Lachnospira sp.]|nr:HPr family phosphocarrier protein [Lachnospira sp.]